ncbi:hypothetical protein [Cerasicoccus maritimus]|uniref:hypothetical protein n=1 Tax=Cerasicoccus maritimus TaxID=490089 RepID=UPI0028525A83|nr:hypothetical protein [Cerasicoccus maritimus]
MIRNLVVGLWGLALLFFTGCESADTPSGAAQSTPMGEDFSGEVAILPADVLSYLPERFEYLYPMVNEAAARSLEAQGYQVIDGSAVNSALDANGGALRKQIASSNSQQMSQGITKLMGQLGSGQSVDALVIPQVLEQSMTLSKPYQGASWGGVRREFHVNGDRNVGSQIQVDTASVVVGVYNRFGQAIYFGQGGIDFLENATQAGSNLYLTPKLSGQIATADVKDALDKALARWQIEYSSLLGQRDSAHAY